MKIHGENIQVDPSEVGPDGEKLEPEERASAHVMSVERDLAMMEFNPLTDLHRSPDFDKATKIEGRGLPTTVTKELKVGEMAQEVASQCFACKHWDRPNWLKRKAELESAVAMKAEATAALDEMRSFIMQGWGTTDGRIVEAVLSRETGLCHVHTELNQAKDFCYTWSGATCPSFRPRDLETVRLGDKTKDVLMRMADQGRKAWWRRVFSGGK